MRGLLIGPAERAALARLRELAAAHPVMVKGLLDRLDTPHGKAAHRDQMTAQSLELPIGYLATFSIETGHPGGTARHLSVSCHGNLPHPAAIWMIAEELGFVGGLELCNAIWPEQLEGHGEAVNVVQFLAQPEPESRQ